MDGYKHSFKDTLKENLGLAVYNTGYQKCGGGYCWGPALRDHFLIHYVAAGRGVYTCRGHAYTLEQGDMFLVYPAEVVRYVADREDPWEYYWVGFNGTEAKRMINLTGLSLDKPVMRPKQAERVRELLLYIYTSSGSTPAADADMVGYLYLFLSCLIRENTCPPADGTQEYLAKALRFIQYNYAAPIRVEDIAAYVGISRSQLYRAFLSRFGLSPHDFLQKYRINEACSLLQGHGYTVAEVAASVGFSDPLYFSRVFRKVKGVPPTAYQKRGIAAPEE